MSRKVLFFTISVIVIASLLWFFKTNGNPRLSSQKFKLEVTTGKRKLRVLAESTFEVRARTQGMVKKVALLPFGKMIQVEANETLVLLDTRTKRQLRQTLLSKKILTKEKTTLNRPPSNWIWRKKNSRI